MNHCSPQRVVEKSDHLHFRPRTCRLGARSCSLSKKSLILFAIGPLDIPLPGRIVLQVNLQLMSHEPVPQRGTVLLYK